MAQSPLIPHFCKIFGSSNSSSLWKLKIFWSDVLNPKSFSICSFTSITVFVSLVGLRDFYNWFSIQKIELLTFKIRPSKLVLLWVRKNPSNKIAIKPCLKIVETSSFSDTWRQNQNLFTIIMNELSVVLNCRELGLVLGLVYIDWCKL